MLNIINQIFEVEQKIVTRGDSAEIGRNIERIKHHLSETGFSYHVPLYEKYSETRTDCVANIVGDLHDDNMFITKVIKPVVFRTDESGNRSIIQKAIVIVEAKR